MHQAVHHNCAYESYFFTSFYPSFCFQAAVPELLLANEAGLEMLGCTAAQLCELSWASTFEDEEGQRVATVAMMKAMQTGSALLPPGVRVSQQGRLAGYEHGVAWKVVDDIGKVHCIAFMLVNWCFLPPALAG